MVVVSGPSGAGKGTLITRVRRRLPDVSLTVSATTRPPRPGESDGREYWFLAPDEFDRRAAAGEFLEHVDYAGRRYGTLMAEVERRRAEHPAVLLEIEVQGARAVRRRLPEAVLVFVAPPSLDELGRRLLARGTNDPADIARRLATADDELAARPEFDAVIVNDDVDAATDQLEALVRAHLPAAGTEA